MPNRHLLNDSASEKLIGEGMKEDKKGVEAKSHSDARRHRCVNN